MSNHQTPFRDSSWRVLHGQFLDSKAKVRFGVQLTGIDSEISAANSSGLKVCISLTQPILFPAKSNSAVHPSGIGSSSIAQA